METSDFLRGVLGSSGHYCVFAARSRDDRRVQKFYDTLNEVEHAAASFDNDGYDVYFALSTFKQSTSRKGDNAEELRALFLDLDCGPSKEYPTQQAAIGALRDFCKKLSLPKPLMVNSGRGVHVYWPLSEPVAAADWIPAAERLKQACADKGLLADPAVTADVARILRVPGTHNYKGDPPLAVSVFGVVMPEPVVLSEFVGKLGVVLKPVTTKIDLGTDALYEAYAENSENVFRKIVDKTVAGKGCEQIKYIMLNQAEVSEPLWRAGLSIAKFCTDGDKAAEKMSSKHPEYDEALMRKKLDEIKGPYTCARFDELREGVCQSCPLWGQIKSPIVLGKRVRESEGEVRVTAPVQGKAQPEEFDIPVYPKPYFRGLNGGVFVKTRNDDGEVEDELIYHYDLYVTRRLHDVELGEVIVFRLHLPKDGVRQFTVPLTSVTSKEEFRKSMAKEGVTAWGRNLDKLMVYTTKWVDELQRTSMADEAHRQFGWVDENMEEFVLGDKLITATEIKYNPPSSKTAGLIDAFEPKGSKEKSIELLNFYNRPGFELHQYIVGIGFGSVLMALTGQNSMSVHLYGGTGVGKTTAQMQALQIWGSPEDLMNAKDDTHNSRMNRGELMHSLPLVSDEMTNITGEQMSEYVYQVSGGRQKNRLSANGNIERARGKPWHLLALSSGNTSAWEVLSRYKASPKAEMQRLFEISVPSMLKTTGDNTDAHSLFNDVKQNYGWLGPEYVQWVIRNKDEARKIIEKTRTNIDKAAHLGPENRFWSNGNAAVLAGLIIAKQLGFVHYDVKYVYQWIISQLLKRKSFVNEIGASVSETINNYLSENYNNILQIKSTQDLRVGSNNNGLDELVVPDALPRGKLIARWETDIKKLYLLPKPFQAWCTDQQLNYAGIVEDLKRHYRAQSQKVRLSKGTQFTLPPTTALVMTFEDFEGVGDEADSNEAG